MGSPLGFEEFYRVSRDPIAHALAFTLFNRELGAEAADEAMTRAYQKWARVGGFANPAGWVYRVGLNWGRSRIRHQQPEVPIGSTNPGVLDREMPDPEVGRVLSRLPLKFRAVVVLRYFAEWTVPEIARSLRIPEGTVKSRLHRAHRRLAGSLEVAR